jgi:phosphate:Na+ symporter
VLAGLGLLFLGIHPMKAGLAAFRGAIDLRAVAVTGYGGVFLFVLIGLMATVVMQSSHATLVLIITALAAQQITYENALALAIGANVGTTITAILGAMSANVEGRRLAVAHLIFNLVTAAIAIGLIYQLTHVVDLISQRIGISEQNYMLKLAVFHTIFNTIGVVAMTPFITPLVTVLERVIQQKDVSVTQPRYLQEAALEFPETAVLAIRKEMLRLYDHALDIIALGLRIKPAMIRAASPVEEIVSSAELSPPIDIDEHYSESIKYLHSMIVAFSSKAQANTHSEPSGELFALRTAGKNMIEAIKDTKHLQKNLNQYLMSDHQAIQHQYSEIRSALACLLIALEQVRSDSDDSAIILSLDHLELEAYEQDLQFDQTLDKLIREHQITPLMATSLMNDKSYADNVTAKLIAMARVLFSTADSMTRGAERSLSMGEYEIGEAFDNFEGAVWPSGRSGATKGEDK